MTAISCELAAVQTHRPIVVKIHDDDRTRARCASPAVAPPLSVGQLAKLTFAGIAGAHAIAALAWGPVTVVHVLVANLTGTPL